MKEKRHNRDNPPGPAEGTGAGADCRWLLRALSTAPAGLTAAALPFSQRAGNTRPPSGGAARIPQAVGALQSDGGRNIYPSGIVREEPKKTEESPSPQDGKGDPEIRNSAAVRYFFTGLKPYLCRMSWPSLLTTKSMNFLPSAWFLPVLPTAMG